MSVNEQEQCNLFLLFVTIKVDPFALQPAWLELCYGVHVDP